MPSTTAYLLIGWSPPCARSCPRRSSRRFARRLGWVAQPDERRSTRWPTPDVGGIAMFVGFVAALAVARLIDQFDPLFAATPSRAACCSPRR